MWETLKELGLIFISTLIAVIIISILLVVICLLGCIILCFLGTIPTIIYSIIILCLTVTVIVYLCG